MTHHITIIPANRGGPCLTEEHGDALIETL
jgi:hypothetical protein